MGWWLVALLGSLFGFVALLNGLARLRRWRTVRSIDPADVVMRAANATVRASLHGVPSFAGLDPDALNRMRGDLVLTHERFLLVVDGGVLADLGPGYGRRFTSARCTGPSRLVIEGEVPRKDGQVGSYRFELVVDDAEGWAEALVPFVEPPAGELRFAVRPPR
jgi:hypothetical protein